MNMLTELFRALALAGTSVFALAFVLTWWGLRRGMLNETGGVDALHKEVKALGKLKPAERTGSNLVHEKWLKFGGGFYGVVALLTWLVIEVQDLATQVPQLLGAAVSFDLGEIIGTVINVFIESIMNFVWAIAWPGYWMQRIHTPAPWAWFLAAWLGYWGGVRLAQKLRARIPGDKL
jgi:hypothetical protein